VLLVAGAATWQARAWAAREAPELLRDVHLSVHTSPESLTVGDRVKLDVQVDAPAGLQVTFPQTAAEDGPVSVKNLKVEVPSAGKGSAPAGAGADLGLARWVGHYTLAVFRVGRITLAPWPVQVSADSLYAVARTDSLELYVRSTLTDSLVKADVRDLKPQAEVPVSPWPWILLGLGLLALAAGVWWWLRRRKRPRAEIVPLAPPRPAHEAALESLSRLESRHLPVDGKFKEYHVQLSEILRRYLEDGFGVAALEETTEEILYDLDRHGFQTVFVAQVRALCEESDLVKFAKHEPTVEECVRSLEHVRDFVVRTTPGRMRLGVPEPGPLSVAPLSSVGSAPGGGDTAA
jgi:hypothetical protein